MTVTINGSGSVLGAGLPQEVLMQARKGSGQTFTASTATTVQLDTITYDTSLRFNNTAATVNGIPAYAFMPTVAGYYEVTALVSIADTSTTYYIDAFIYKNGANFQQVGGSGGNGSGYGRVSGSALVYLNGSTDYIQLWATCGQTKSTAECFMSAVLVRADSILPNYSSPFTVGITNNGPSFRATVSTTQALASGAWTLLAYDTESWDTASCYNNTGSTVGGTTAYAFRPNVAGYYQVNATAAISNGTSGATIILSLWKNGGGEYCRGTRYEPSTGGNWAVTVADMVYLNGSTDYIDARFYSGAAANIEAGSFNGTFSANLARLP